MDPVTEPSDRDTKGFISAPKLVFFTVSHTINLKKKIQRKLLRTICVTSKKKLQNNPSCHYYVKNLPTNRFSIHIHNHNHSTPSPVHLIEHRPRLYHLPEWVTFIKRLSYYTIPCDSYKCLKLNNPCTSYDSFTYAMFMFPGSHIIITIHPSVQGILGYQTRKLFRR